MDLLTILYGVVFGLFLTIGDGMGIHHRIRYSARAGLFTWLGLVGLPLIICGFLSWKIAAVGMLVSFVLSGALALKLKLERRAKAGKHPASTVYLN